MSFESWMNDVDQLVLKATKMSIHDLPDMAFRDAFDDGATPEEFVEENLGIEDGEIVDTELFREAVLG